MDRNLLLFAVESIEFSRKLHRSGLLPAFQGNAAITVRSDDVQLHDRISSLLDKLVILGKLHTYIQIIEKQLGRRLDQARIDRLSIEQASPIQIPHDPPEW